MEALVIKSSILGEASASSKWAGELARKLGLEGKAEVLDLAADPVPVLDAQSLAESGDPQSAYARRRSELIAQLRAAKRVILCAPMYNFSVPAQLKNWFDAVSAAGVTFRYGPSGPEGLLEDRPVDVVATRGGMYREKGLTFHEDYLRMQLGLLGLRSVRFVFIEGVNMGLGEDAYRRSFEDQTKG